MENVIFIAPPAAGKGTLSQMLSERYAYKHISTGDILREEVNSGSNLGLKIKDIMASGKLVSDEIVIELISSTLNNLGETFFILDGFPRTLKQAQALTEILAKKDIKYKVIYLDISEELAKKRILGRRVCSCGRVYNIYSKALKPLQEGICDACGQKLITRSDDNEESFKIRFHESLKNNKPLLDYYQKLNNLNIIKISDDKDAIFAKILEVIKND